MTDPMMVFENLLKPTVPLPVSPSAQYIKTIKDRVRQEIMGWHWLRVIISSSLIQTVFSPPIILKQQILPFQNINMTLMAVRTHIILPSPTYPRITITACTPSLVLEEP